MTEWRHRGAMSEYMSAGNPRMLCRECRLPWPCDTRVVLDALAKADAASVDDVAALQEAVAIGDRAEAHAKALAEALREATRQTTSENDGLTERWR